MRVVLAGLVVVAALFAQTPAPDVIIMNVRVYTGDAANPWAGAVAIIGSRITAVGDAADIQRTRSAKTRVIDAAGRLLIPGINDAHTHVGASPQASTLEGPPAMEHDPTVDEVIARIRAAVATTAPRGWIGGEIGSAVLEDSRATRATFDSISGDHPLMLTSWTGHGTIVNTAALRALGISDTEPDPPGGVFARAADGRTLTGLAHEYAEFALRRRASMLATPDEYRRAVERYTREAASFGITSSQLIMTAYPVDRASALLADAQLAMRVRLIDFPLTAMSAWRPREPRLAPASTAVTVSGTKWILDGTPVERWMWLREPYADAPSTRGRANFSDADLRAFLRRALDAREQPMIHAVGDAAIGAALDALETTGGERWKPLRPRIEHGDMTQASDFERMTRMGIFVVQNPSHFMVPQYMAPRLGGRTKRVTMVKSIVEAGVPFALGSDGPMNPFLNIMFATINANNPPEALTVEQALRAYTSGSAAAEFAEREKGMIRTGMLADMALLSQDIFRVPPPELPKTVSALTIVNGRIVYESKQ